MCVYVCVYIYIYIYIYLRRGNRKQDKLLSILVRVDKSVNKSESDTTLTGSWAIDKTTSPTSARAPQPPGTPVASGPSLLRTFSQITNSKY